MKNPIAALRDLLAPKPPRRVRYQNWVALPSGIELQIGGRVPASLPAPDFFGDGMVRCQKCGQANIARHTASHCSGDCDLGIAGEHLHRFCGYCSAEYAERCCDMPERHVNVQTEPTPDSERTNACSQSPAEPS